MIGPGSGRISNVPPVTGETGDAGQVNHAASRIWAVSGLDM